jgi:ankyrin repeat protein
MSRRAASAGIAAVWLLVGSAAALAAADAPLINAVKGGDRTAVRTLIKGGADVNAREVDGTTPLHWAVRSDDMETAALLLGGRANPNALNRYGVTPLSLAARNGNAAMLELLLKHGADVKAADAAASDGQTLLMLAARTGRVEAMKQLVGRGVNVNAIEPRNGTSALMWAAVQDRGDAIRFLAEAGADLNARSKITQYPHTPAAVVSDALEPGVSYVGQTVLPKGGWTPLMYAAREGAVGAIRALAETKADLNAQDPEGTTALIFAIINGHADAAAALIEKGADLNLADKTGMTPLYAAVDMHTLASGFGRPDLTPTVVADTLRTIDALIAAGADLNAPLKSRVPKRVYNAGDGRLGEGATPFMRAARGGDVVVMKKLLAAGADPKLVQKSGVTPIHLAAGLGGDREDNNPLRGGEAEAIAAIELCLERGLDINAVSTTGESVVHSALGSPKIIRFLVQKGARLDFKNKQGRTPLEQAATGREPDVETIAVLKELTGAGAPPSKEPTGVN